MARLFDKLVSKILDDKDIDWEQLEANLIASDIGIRPTIELIEEFQKLGRQVKAHVIVAKVREKIYNTLPVDQPPLLPLPSGSPYVITMIGVNGVGKTTSAAKLAALLKSKGYSVLLVAADTFRAAAVEQLQRWAERLEIPFLKGNPQADPSSVCYTGHQKAIKEGIQFVICDTAGRLHTKSNLMAELQKIKRTLGKNDPDSPHLTLLTVDATTGSNALQQAKEFSKVTPIDGLIMTKLDGSGKGGVAASIYRELQLPTRFIGTGEEPDQFEYFQRKRFVEELL